MSKRCEEIYDTYNNERKMLKCKSELKVMELHKHNQNNSRYPLLYLQFLGRVTLNYSVKYTYYNMPLCSIIFPDADLLFYIFLSAPETNMIQTFAKILTIYIFEKTNHYL